MKEGKYALSVIVPVYGVEKYIAQCARSLFSQDMQGLEFIFVDDCSPDNSIPILETIINCEYPSLKEDIQIIRLPQNKGVSNARNVGISKATGEYVTFCDSDDWIDADMYSSLYSKAKETNADISACNFVNEYDGYKIIYNQPFSSDVSVDLRRIIRGDIFPSLWSYIVRRSTYIENAIRFPDGLNVGEDLFVNVLIYSNIKILVFIPKPLYHYRRHENSICSRRNIDSIESDIKIALLIENFLFVKNLLPLYKMEVCYRKFFSKLPLWTNQEVKDYNRWRSLYKETHKYILLYQRLNWKMKCEYFLAAYGFPKLAVAFRTIIVRLHNNMDYLFRFFNKKRDVLL